MAGPKYPEWTKNPIGTWDKEDKDGRETEHTRGAKFATGDERVTRTANKTKHIYEGRGWLMATSESPAFGRAFYAARIEVCYRRRSNHREAKQD